MAEAGVAVLDRIIAGANWAEAFDGENGRSPMPRLVRRDELIRRAASQFYGDQSLDSAARKLHAALARYAAAGWARDRDAATCPRPAASIEAAAWQLLAAGVGVPSARTIRRLLARGGHPPVNDKTDRGTDQRSIFYANAFWRQGGEFFDGGP